MKQGWPTASPGMGRIKKGHLADEEKSWVAYSASQASYASLADVHVVPARTVFVHPQTRRVPAGPAIHSPSQR